MPVSLSAATVTASSLAATAITLEDGLYPGFYGGTGSFPGRGNTLSGVALSASTLTASAA